MAVVPLVRDEISIGRKEGNTIRLTERNVSRQHCRIQRVNGSYVIRDLGSYNGVLVNGLRVEGEAPVQPGDEIRVGDYTLVLEGDAAKQGEAAPVATSSQPPAPPATPASAPVPVAALPTPAPVEQVAALLPPARLVVLTAPLAGAEFSLVERGELRIGRSPDLDITIDHRSVSREHAKIVCSAGEARIVDLGSVNGVLVNGHKVSEVGLSPDDRIELGDIVLRFIGAGQHFVFEPTGVAGLLARRRGAIVAAIILAVSLAIAIAIVQWARAGRSSQRPAEPAAAAVETTKLDDPEVEARARARAAEQQTLREACRKANQAERFAEAVANANAALKIDAGDAEAQACARVARANHEQEQVFVRAKAAVEQGDPESAWHELKNLVTGGPIARRPDVLSLVTDVVEDRLDQAQALLASQPVAAAELAREASVLPLAPDALRTQALALAEQAESAPARSRGHAAPKRGRDARELREKPAPATEAAQSAPPTTGSSPSPMQAATACLARGDSKCVIKSLDGRAESAQELGLLIETYRAVGNFEQAQRNMTVYVQRFPSGKRADIYRELLRRGPR